MGDSLKKRVADLCERLDAQALTIHTILNIVETQNTCISDLRRCICDLEERADANDKRH